VLQVSQEVTVEEVLLLETMAVKVHHQEVQEETMVVEVLRQEEMVADLVVVEAEVLEDNLLVAVAAEALVAAEDNL
jgi:hypothetical protein